MERVWPDAGLTPADSTPVEEAEFQAALAGYEKPRETCAEGWSRFHLKLSFASSCQSSSPCHSLHRSGARCRPRLHAHGDGELSSAQRKRKPECSVLTREPPFGNPQAIDTI